MAESSVQGLSLWAVALATYLASASLISDGSKQLLAQMCL